MRVAVLGAGVEGVAAAWYLRQAGHDVQVLERREGPGLETSFANGGQISADHAAPWAEPGAPLQALKWLLREETGLQYDQVARGILVLYTEGRKSAPGMKTPDECVAIEPALASLRHRLTGGRYFPDDESGDAYKFTTELAKLCVEKGVRFDFDVDIKGFSVESEKISNVNIQRTNSAPKTLRADAYVLALGSYSPRLGRAETRNAEQHSLHRPHEISEPLPEHRSRHPRLDPRLRLRPHPRRPHQRTAARSGDRRLLVSTNRSPNFPTRRAIDAAPQRQLEKIVEYSLRFSAVEHPLSPTEHRQERKQHRGRERSLMK